MKKIFTSLLIVMLLLIFGTGVVVTRSLSPYKQARNEAVDLINRRTNFDIINEEDFYWYNGEESYFTVAGETNNGEHIVAIIQQNSGAIEIFDQKDVIPKQDIINKAYEDISPQKIFSVRIGISDSTPVWEVSFRQDNGNIGYILYSLTSGEWLKTIKNI